MIDYELRAGDGILVIRPQGSLEAADFQRIAAEVDPYLEAHGKLQGVMIEAKAFPGWKDFAALVAHLRFVKNHHRQIEKVAVVSDSAVLTFLPLVASHFVQADVRHFDHADAAQAQAWLREGS